MDIENQDREAMDRLVRGDDDALNDLMTRHRDAVAHFLLRMLQNETAALDLAQETFVRVYQNRERFNASQKFSTWLFTIAANLARDRLRWHARHPQVSLTGKNDQDDHALGDVLPSRDPDPSRQLADSERAQYVQRAIADLPEDLRAPLILSEYENLSHAEIGSILNCSSKAIEMRLYRARQALREKLSPVLNSI